ncbi:MAG: hypothetical protein IJM55_07655 [Ruminococcus sp.]|jgi:hypothetical protein|nr:hypothetical protein [Ruminococcus sp.]
MNIETVKSLFRLFTGEDEATETNAALIDLAVNETERMLLPEADSSDPRLNFLSAAIAAYRLRQILASRDREKYTYAGKMPDTGKGSPADSAEKLLRNYLDLCSDLIAPKTFIFMSTSGRKE